MTDRMAFIVRERLEDPTKDISCTSSSPSLIYKISSACQLILNSGSGRTMSRHSSKTITGLWLWISYIGHVDKNGGCKMEKQNQVDSTRRSESSRKSSQPTILLIPFILAA